MLYEQDPDVLGKINDTPPEMMKDYDNNNNYDKRRRDRKDKWGSKQRKRKKRKERKTQKSCFGVAEGKKFSSPPKYLTGYEAPTAAQIEMAGGRGWVLLPRGKADGK